ncbi:hypothetical protein GDO81_026277 [Engystomops pustulosus]|uniref:Uncharacterized protein n=1 Tax=Engystomops pustulosus TaxID=76066 RepID=A0AAV6ZLF1_ENGPU|nr:hypothetical protein GDO81_026277 [Engystomops pustulosus]
MELLLYGLYLISSWWSSEQKKDHQTASGRPGAGMSGDGGDRVMFSTSRGPTGLHQVRMESHRVDRMSGRSATEPTGQEKGEPYSALRGRSPDAGNLLRTSG